MAEIKWEEPQALERGARAGHGKYAAVAEELRQRPGQWAIVAENVAPQITRYLRTRYGLEATCRGVENGRAEKVYARWPVSG